MQAKMNNYAVQATSHSVQENASKCKQTNLLLTLVKQLIFRLVQASCASNSKFRMKIFCDKKPPLQRL